MQGQLALCVDLVSTLVALCGVLGVLAVDAGCQGQVDEVLTGCSTTVGHDEVATGPASPCTAQHAVNRYSWLTAHYELQARSL
jgi:hypothetical protein